MARQINCNELKFALYEFAHEMKMYESHFKNNSWDEGKIVPFHNIELSPAANILNYGQGIFEGLKAYRSARGRIVMFRPQENARRFVRSAEKLAIPGMTEEKFFQAIKQVVRANKEFIPESPDGRCSLYLRPVCIGTEPLLGVRASKEYLFYIFASPVGPYYDRVGVVRFIVTDVHRAAPHGTGDAKAVCNYAVTLKPKQKAKSLGFDDALYLDTIHHAYIEEAGAANFFALMDTDLLVTPSLGSILPGITRNSIIRIAREMFDLRVEEWELGIEEVCRQARECFVTGTGAIITSVSEIEWKGELYNVNRNDFQLAHRLYDKLIGIQLQREEDPYGWVLEID